MSHPHSGPRPSRGLRWFPLAGLTVVAALGLYAVFARQTRVNPPAPVAAASGAVTNPVASARAEAATTAVADGNAPKTNSNLVAALGTNQFNLKLNPYAGALREPGKSKRAWDATFLTQLPAPTEGQPIRFELTEGRMAVGTIRIIQREGGEVSYLSGELTEPEAGKFFFLKPPVGGKAGKAVGVIELPASQTAYRIEPTGANGDPELWQRRLDEVVCMSMPIAAEGALTNETANMPPLRPDLVSGLVPAYNTNIQNKALISLQSLPGARGVLLLDFFGGYTPTWGGVNYPAPNVRNDEIREVWKRVAEDYQPFNINVTTDIKVYQAAPSGSRMRVVYTPSTSAVGSGSAGVAFIGSWNWGGDNVCWSIYYTGKGAGEVGAHEAGHTFGLGHQGTSTQGYEDGHGSGETGWAPIMGAGYYQNVVSWARGEYQDANNTEDELNIIVGNNDVDYRADDTGATLETARHLEIYPDLAATAEGVIETTEDTDAFQFTTTGGRVALTANPVGDWSDLAVSVALVDENGNVLATDNPQDIISASIVMDVAPGTYTFQVTGAGRNDPVTTGFTSYGSLGYYSIAGSVDGARLPTRLNVFEHVPNGTVVGTVTASAPADPLAYAIVSGNINNTFALANNGALTVANSTALDYLRLATNTMLPVQYELFVNITNLNDGNLTELNRRVVVALRTASLNYPVAFTGFNARVIASSKATTGSPGATAFDIPNSWCFYQAGLNLNPQVNSGGGRQGLPANGIVLSPEDGTMFQLGPFGATNALMLGNSYPRSGTLRLVTPQPFNSLSILASSANGGGLGTLVLNYTNGQKSQTLNLNAQDWYNTTTNVAALGFGRLRLGQGTLTTENPGWNNPNLYQTTLNLAALGINQTISSISFTNPNVGGSMSSGIFALSGAVMPPAVNITLQPRSVTNSLPAQNATFFVTAQGAPPLGYQWYFSQSGAPGSFEPLAGRVATNLVLSAVLQSSNAGSYYVVVTNSSSAATSSVATLTLFREPVITRQPSPTNLTLFAGRSTLLSVAANAALPVNYYWNVNGTNYAYTSVSNSTLSNLQVPQSGDYTVVVSNAFGAATSSIVALTVLPSPTNFPYVQSVLTGNPFAYYRLNETSGTVAHDYVNGRNGTYTGVTLNQPGYNPLDADRAIQVGPAVNSYVGKIPVNFATTSNAVFSVEAWVKAGAQTTDAGILTRGTGAGGEQFNLDTGAGNHAYRFFVRDASGAARLANGNVVPNNSWQHIVGVCNQTAGQLILYVNGISNASGTIPTNSGLLISANDTTIGSRQSGTTTYDNQFNGSIDEVAIYNYALTPAQIQARYALRTNMPPLFTVNPFTKAQATAGVAYSGTLVGTATDANGGVLTYSKISGPDWLAVAGNGTLSGTPAPADAGPNSFTVRATDITGLFNNAIMNLPVVDLTPFTVSVTADATTLSLSWSGGTAPYQVLMTTNLANPVWVEVGGPTAGNTLQIPLSNSAAFYRVAGQ